MSMYGGKTVTSSLGELSKVQQEGHTGRIYEDFSSGIGLT